MNPSFLLAAFLLVSPPGVAREDVPVAPVSDLPQRLAALDPARPEEYFGLGEEVAAEMPDAEGRRLARTLYVLAFELDRARARTPDNIPLGPSVCLALAEIASDAGERTRLATLAASLGVAASARSSPPAGGTPRQDAAAAEAAFSLATALGYVRAGENARAAPILARPEVRRLLDKYSDFVGGSDALVRDVAARPACNQCRNARVVRDERAGPTSLNDAATPMRVCPTCGGRPGPHLSERRYIDHLRLESILLSGTQRSWSAQLIADGGAPLRELTAADLATSYDVDPDRTVWRDGVWTRP